MAPSSDRFVRYDNASLQQHFLDQQQAERKPEIQPNRMGDDLRRKAVVHVTDRRRGHPAQLSVNR